MNRKHLSFLTGLLALTAMLASAALAADEPATLADALARAQVENKMVVIDFYTDW